MNILKLFALIIFFGFSTSVAAFEFSVVRASTEVKSIDKVKPYELLDEVLAPSFVKAYIGFNEQVGTLYFEVNAKKRSKIRLEYNNDDLLFSKFASSEEIAINAPGESTAISFTVFGPVSGRINILNEKNQLLKTVTYIVRKENRYRQSLRGNVSNSKTATSKNDTSTSLSYSLSKKTIHGADPYWNLDASLSANVDNPEERTVSLGFGYSW